MEVFYYFERPDKLIQHVKKIIASKKNLRLLILENMFENTISHNFKSIEGGVLFQSNDNHKLSKDVDDYSSKIAQKTPDPDIIS